MGEPKTDCFAYILKTTGREECAALDRLYCTEGECRFYKRKMTLCDSCNKKRYYDCGFCRGVRKNLV